MSDAIKTATAWEIKGSKNEKLPYTPYLALKSFMLLSRSIFNFYDMLCFVVDDYFYDV